MLSMQLVHIHSRNVILLIGGRNKGESINCHRYCMVTQTWKEIENIKFPLTNFCAEDALLTKNEKQYDQVYQMISILLTSWIKIHIN